MEIFEEKAALREQIRAARAAITPEARKAAEDALCERLYSLPAVRKARIVGTCQAFGSEISVHDLVRALRLTDGPAIAYPAIHGHGEMSMVRVEHGELPAFVANPLAVIDPAEVETLSVDPASLDVLLVPGIAFDEARHRLGQGGGYYDRFLARVGEDCLTIGIAFDEQIVGAVPAAGHDRGVDYVVTPSRIIS